MQVIILIAFALTLTLASYEITDDNAQVVGLGPWTAAAVAAYLAGTALLSRLAARAAIRAMARPNPAGKPLWRRDLLHAASQVWLVGGSGTLMVLGYGQWAFDLPSANWPLVSELLLIAPFTAALVLAWLADYPAHLAVRAQVAAAQQSAGLTPPPAWSRLEYLGYNLRHNLLFAAVPVAMIFLLKDVLSLWVVPAMPSNDLAQWILAGGMVASACAVFVVAPALIVRIWRTGTMPRGQLRARLEAICRRMKLRYRDILIWRTGGMISNAGVMGLIPQVRYILMSDALLTQMTPHEVEAIFAHEAGHIVSHHIFYSAIFAVTTMILATCAADLLKSWLGMGDLEFNLAALAILMAFWAGGFGWLSRRFERQSDVIGAWAMGRAFSQGGEPAMDPAGESAMTAVALPAEAAPAPAAGDTTPADGRITPEGAAVFARALQRVAELNGLPPNKRNWRHGSIAWRVQYILWLGAMGKGREEIDRLVRRIKIGLWVSLGASIALWAVLEKLRG